VLAAVATRLASADLGAVGGPARCAGLAAGDDRQAASPMAWCGSSV